MQDRSMHDMMCIFNDASHRHGMMVLSLCSFGLSKKIVIQLKENEGKAALSKVCNMLSIRRTI